MVTRCTAAALYVLAWCANKISHFWQMAKENRLGQDGGSVRADFDWHRVLCGTHRRASVGYGNEPSLNSGWGIGASWIRNSLRAWRRPVFDLAGPAPRWNDLNEYGLKFPQVREARHPTISKIRRAVLLDIVELSDCRHASRKAIRANYPIDSVNGVVLKLPHKRKTQVLHETSPTP
jgi:hypothetical protein